jgi:hypothetical protein
MIYSTEKRAMRRSGRTWRLDPWRANREKAIHKRGSGRMTGKPEAIIVRSRNETTLPPQSNALGPRLEDLILCLIA